MKHRRNCSLLPLFGLALAIIFSAKAAPLPSDWQHEQSFDVARPDLVKLSVPIETLDAARPGLEDLRVYDDAGNEVPYLIEHPAPAEQIVHKPKSFQASLNPQNTVITIETGFTQAIDRIILVMGAKYFIKSVTVEGSSDGQHWEEIARGKAIFYQDGGVLQRELEIPPKIWPWLRLTIDDQRSAPIPFTGAYIRAASGESAPSEETPVTIANRMESPGETRLTVDLPAANLNLSEIRIDSPDPMFTREVDVCAPEIVEEPLREKAIEEQTVGAGIIYRLAIEGQPASANLSIPMKGSQVRSRELVLRIRNNDSPPLTVTGVHVERRPVYLVFLAKQAGPLHLLSGNPLCTAPRYDLAAFSSNLRTVTVAPMKFSAMIQNPAFHPREVLPEIQDNGAPLDPSAWRFRKLVTVTHTGAQVLEPDFDLLSHSQLDFEDVRLLRDGRQVPYVVELTSITRGIVPEVTLTNDVKNPRISRWIIKLPRSGVRFSSLNVNARSPLFKRDMVLSQELADERGEKSRDVLDGTTWTHTPLSLGTEFGLVIDSRMKGDTLYLETDNGDNPPLELEKFTLFYPVTRILFKAKENDSLLLYYGNAEAAAPRYDLSLVANELLAADKSVATLGGEESLKKSTWRANGTSGKGGVVLWGILALVVVVLLIVISRLLPKSESQPPK